MENQRMNYAQSLQIGRYADYNAKNWHNATPDRQ